MYNGVASPEACADVKTFIRNRYFYGKLLDVSHFESEQAYFNEKRRLLNRLVTGYGVICGLNVGLTEDMKQIWVDPGVAIDKAGREIVVPVRAKPVPIPVPEPAPPGETKAGSQQDEEGDDSNIGSVYICYHDCPGDPEPVLAGDCDSPEPCSTGSIRERYTIEIRPGKAHRVDLQCEIPGIFAGGKLDYKELANFVTSCCPAVPDDVCIPLANLKLMPAGQTCSHSDIDISVRPIVYTNDLLFELLLGLTSYNQNRPKGGKY
jgi:hypothetical protein